MPSRRVLVTGGSGFVGQWVCRRLLERGDLVFGGTIGQATGPAVLTDSQRGAVQWLQLDTGSQPDIARALGDSAPTHVIHLAALSFLQDAAAEPTKAFDINALGAFRILHQLSMGGAKGVRVLIVGSAEQYGLQAAATGPIPESAAQAPHSVYGAAKAAQELIALQLGRASGIAVVCTRSFNHSGFGQSPQFLLPSLVERARALPARGGSLRLGNTTPVRDYLHVADVVAAYDALLDDGVAGEAYNVASGVGSSVGEVVGLVLKGFRISAEVSQDPALVREVDIPVLLGDNTKLKAATGWRPKFSLDDIIDDLIHAKAR
jgi:GDP-4-dehydro-6-deoxy-D-mannose reductase